MSNASDIDLSSMSKSELKSLRKKVDKAIEDYDAQKKREALAALKEEAQKHGFKLDDLVQETSGKKGRRVSVAKYAHPENPSMTWTGKGRQPNWIKEGLESGNSLDDYLIGKKEKENA
jgi:DNA-binding protein H-NS